MQAEALSTDVTLARRRTRIIVGESSFAVVTGVVDLLGLGLEVGLRRSMK